jgi:hypothetical protein
MRGPSEMAGSRPDASTPASRIRPTPTAVPIHGSDDARAEAVRAATIPASPNSRAKLAVIVPLTAGARLVGLRVSWPSPR